MSKIKPVLKTALAFFLSSLATIVSFGLILYLLWSTLSHEMFYKINPVLKVISFSIFLGGFILTWITRDKTHLKPAIFGFLFGFFGLLYFVGFEYLVISKIILATIFALGGSFLFHLLFPGYPKANPDNA